MQLQQRHAATERRPASNHARSAHWTARARRHEVLRKDSGAGRRAVRVTCCSEGRNPGHAASVERRRTAGQDRQQSGMPPRRRAAQASRDGIKIHMCKTRITDRHGWQFRGCDQRGKDESLEASQRNWRLCPEIRQGASENDVT